MDSPYTKPLGGEPRMPNTPEIRAELKARLTGNFSTGEIGRDVRVIPYNLVKDNVIDIIDGYEVLIAEHEKLKQEFKEVREALSKLPTSLETPKDLSSFPVWTMITNRSRSTQIPIAGLFDAASMAQPIIYKTVECSFNTLFYKLPFGWYVRKADGGTYECRDKSGKIHVRAYNIQDLVSMSFEKCLPGWEAENKLVSEKENLEKRLREINEALNKSSQEKVLEDH